MNHHNYHVHIGATVQTDSTQGEIIKVTKVIQHENYDNEKTNQDLSLLFLERVIAFDISKQPIGLAKILPPPDAITTVTGYGFVDENGPLSKQLLKVNLPLFDHNKCNTVYHGIITEYMICAGYIEGGMDACQVRSY